MNALDNRSYFDLNLTVTEGGYFKSKADVDWSMAMHSSAMCKFYYITKGTCEITIEDVTYTARAGDWFFIPARTPHSYHNFNGVVFEKYWMHFYISPARNIPKLLGAGYLLSLKERKEVNRLFGKFVKLFPGKNFAERIEVKAIALELLSLFIKESEKKEDDISALEDSAISEVFDYIDRNMDRLIRNETLAEIAHMHPTHFIRFFKAETGQTPKEYINGRKMEIAKAMLEGTELPISEISESLGFFDSMHFSKTFKKRYSISPTAYRKMHLV